MKSSLISYSFTTLCIGPPTPETFTLGDINFINWSQTDPDTRILQASISRCMELDSPYRIVIYVHSHSPIDQHQSYDLS